MRIVQLEEGYLKLDNTKAEDLFEKLIDNGTFWEYVSQTFNDNALGLSNINAIPNEINSIKILIDMMLVKVIDIDSKIDSLPTLDGSILVSSKTDSSTEELSQQSQSILEVASDIIDETAKEDTTPKLPSSSSAFSSTLDKFTKMRKKRK